MALELTVDYRLRWMDFDRFGRIKPFALLDLFQDVATMQAEQMGIGGSAMNAKGVFWAVIRLKYEIVRDPSHFQAVSVRSWPHSPSRFSFMRDFHVRDETGDLLAKASTEWVLMDVETRKFASVKDYYDAPDDLVVDRAFDGRLRKVPGFQEGNRPVSVFVPGYSDIDLNGHVNNAAYANFIVDALTPDGRGSVKTLQIDYRHEVLPGSPLSVHTLVEDGRVLSKGVREDGNTAFASLMELR